VLSIALGAGAGWLLGWEALQGVTVGTAISVVSTMALSRLRSDRGELQSQPGRLMIGITLIEDLAVVALTILLPSLRSFHGGRLAILALEIGKSLLLLVPILAVAFRLAPLAMARVARMQNDELYVLVSTLAGLRHRCHDSGARPSARFGGFPRGTGDQRIRAFPGECRRPAHGPSRWATISAISTTAISSRPAWAAASFNIIGQ